MIRKIEDRSSAAEQALRLYYHVYTTTGYYPLVTVYGFDLCKDSEGSALMSYTQFVEQFDEVVED